MRLAALVLLGLCTVGSNRAAVVNEATGATIGTHARAWWVTCSSCEDLYQTPLPREAEIAGRVVGGRVSEQGLVSSYIDVSDGGARSVRVYYAYANMPVRVAKTGFVMARGKVTQAGRMQADRIAVIAKP